MQVKSASFVIALILFVSTANMIEIIAVLSKDIIIHETSSKQDGVVFLVVRKVSFTSYNGTCTRYEYNQEMWNSNSSAAQGRNASLNGVAVCTKYPCEQANQISSINCLQTFGNYVPEWFAVPL